MIGFAVAYVVFRVGECRNTLLAMLILYGRERLKAEYVDCVTTKFLSVYLDCQKKDYLCICSECQEEDACGCYFNKEEYREYKIK